MNKAQKKQYGAHLPTILERKGWPLDIYGPVYNKCAQAQILTGDEYKIGMDLHEIGLMTITRTPIWNGDQYKGVKISFLAFVPIYKPNP